MSKVEKLKKKLEKKNKIKYCKLILFSKILPILRKDIMKNLTDFNYTKKNLIYFLLGIMDKCNFRIGYDVYKTKGLTGITVNDIVIKKKEITIKFIGKKKVLNICSIKDFYIAKLLTNLSSYNKKNIKKFNKNQEPLIFAFKNKDKFIKISAFVVNNVLSKYGNITVKIFRTWGANTEFIKYMQNTNIPKTEKEIKLNIKNAVEKVSQKLNNTPGICKRAYI